MGHNPQARAASLTPRDRLRRPVILCCSFAKNLAYYRAGQDSAALRAGADFWRVANNNFLDMCVLEWCKLFAEKGGKHYWGKVIEDSATFETRLLSHLGLADEEFQGSITVMKGYRDRFVAHLDEDRTMIIPRMDVAQRAVWFYHGQIVSKEAAANDLVGLATDLDTGYKICMIEAQSVYQLVRSRPS